MCIPLTFVSLLHYRDRKKKKFINESGRDNVKKRVLTESGTWIKASYKSNLLVFGGKQIKHTSIEVVFISTYILPSKYFVKLLSHQQK